MVVSVTRIIGMQGIAEQTVGKSNVSIEYFSM